LTTVKNKTSIDKISNSPTHSLSHTHLSQSLTHSLADWHKVSLKLPSIRNTEHKAVNIITNMAAKSHQLHIFFIQSGV